jgi:hypothetical protein
MSRCTDWREIRHVDTTVGCREESSRVDFESSEIDLARELYCEIIFRSLVLEKQSREKRHQLTSPYDRSENNRRVTHGGTQIEIFD